MNRIREIREDNDYKQDYIASIIGVKQHTYSRYENGKHRIPVEVYEKLADFYDTSVDYLLYRTDIKKPPKKSIVEDIQEDNVDN